MQLNFEDEWIKRMADLEDGCDVSAGAGTMPAPASEQTHHARAEQKGGEMKEKPHEVTLSIAADAQTVAALQRHITELELKVQELGTENTELNQLFELQTTRYGEATKLWRDAHPEKKHVLPDLGDLLQFLIARGDKKE